MPPGDGAPLWYAEPPEYALVADGARVVFSRPDLHGHKRRVLARALRHPFWTARTLGATRDIRATAALHLWRETACWFGFDTVEIPGAGGIRPVTPLRRGCPAPAASAPPADPPITGLVIAQDEARLIARALRSLAPYVARTVVVDGGSTDGTAAIAEREGALVIGRAFDSDFAAQRNAGLEHVTTPWVLSL